MQSVENIPTQHLESSPEDPPRLVVLLDTENNVEGIYIVGDRCKTFAQTCNVLDAVI